MESLPEGKPFADQPPGFLSYADIASYLKVSTRTVMRWVESGCIPSPQYHGSLARFPADYLVKLGDIPVSLPGTYEVADSIRRSGKVMSVVRAKLKAKRKKPAAKKPAAKKPAAKKPAAKKKAGAK